MLGAYVGSEHASPIEKALGGLPHPGTLDPTLQWERLRNDPSNFVTASWHMATRQGDRITSTALFDYGLWVPPWWLAVLGFMLLALIRFSTPEADRARLSRVERCLLLTLLAMLCAIMLLSLFVYDTVTDQTSLEITGMQGRYLAPLLPLLMITIPALPRLRTRWQYLIIAQTSLFGIVMFAVIFGVYPSYFVQILQAIPQ